MRATLNDKDSRKNSGKKILRGKNQRKWKQDNREAIEAYNRRIERDGVFSDGLRTF
jgi:antitoxin CcdA